MLSIREFRTLDPSLWELELCFNISAPPTPTSPNSRKKSQIAYCNVILVECDCLNKLDATKA